MITLLAVGLLAAPLALASGPGSGEDHAAAGKARGEERRTNATATSEDHRGNASERSERNVTSDRANMTAARAAWRENATLVRESWHENATAVRESCRAAGLDHANAGASEDADERGRSSSTTQEQQTAHAQCIKTGYASWREANVARLKSLRDAFLAFLGARGHIGS